MAERLSDEAINTIATKVLRAAAEPHGGRVEKGREQWCFKITFRDGSAEVTANEEFSGGGYFRHPTGRVKLTVCGVRGRGYRSVLKARTFKPRKDGSYDVAGIGRALVAAATAQARIDREAASLDSRLAAANALLLRVVGESVLPPGVSIEAQPTGLLRLTFDTDDAELARRLLNAWGRA